MRETQKRKKERAQAIIDVLQQEYPDAHCSLHFANPLELLIATILSAQCTDDRVNMVTEVLFKKYRTAADYAAADLTELEEDIRSTGFYRNKAKNIKSCCRTLIEQYNGDVPAALDDLVALAGVGRKTANVVLGNAYGIPGMVVDTHVGRISQRLGLTKQTDPEHIEFDLMKVIPKDHWNKFSHELIYHGRKICKARGPQHNACPLRSLCPTGRGQEA